MGRTEYFVAARERHNQAGLHGRLCRRDLTSLYNPEGFSNVILFEASEHVPPSSIGNVKQHGNIDLRWTPLSVAEVILSLVKPL